MSAGEERALALGPIADARAAALDDDSAARADALAAAGNWAASYVMAGLASTLAPGRLPRALTREGLTALQSDLRHLDAPRVVRGFPRTPGGRYDDSVTLVLSSYPSRDGAERDLVCGARTDEAGRQRLALDLAIGALLLPGAHLWAAARWRWDRRNRDASDIERFGVALSWADAGDAARLPALLARVHAGEVDDDGVRASAELLLLDEARFIEALHLEDLVLSRRAEQLLAGDDAAFGDAPPPPGWRDALERALGAAAPWRLPWLLDETDDDRLLWAPDAVPGAQRAAVLLALGAGAQLVLAESASGALRLDVVAGNDLGPAVPAGAWQRPVELDLIRFGYETP